MNALILITRTYTNEFLNYHGTAKYVTNSSKELDSLLIDGSQFYIENPETEIKEYLFVTLKNSISDKLNKQYENTVIAIHHNLNFNDIKKVLENLFNESKWGKLTVKEYSGKGNEAEEPVYKNILFPLQSALNQNEPNETTINNLLDRLYLFFSGDPVLEAKLELLHSLLVPPADLNSDYNKWNELKKVTKDTVSSKEKMAWKSFACEPINGKIASEYHNTPFDEHYIKALSELRDKLLQDY